MIDSELFKILSSASGIVTVDYIAEVSKLSAKGKKELGTIVKIQKLQICSADYGNALESGKYIVPEYAKNSETYKQLSSMLKKHNEKGTFYLVGFRFRSISETYKKGSKEIDFKTVFEWLVPSEQKKLTTPKDEKKKPPYLNLKLENITRIAANGKVWEK